MSNAFRTNSQFLEADDRSGASVDGRCSGLRGMASRAFCFLGPIILALTILPGAALATAKGAKDLLETYERVKPVLDKHFPLADLADAFGMKES